MKKTLFISHSSADAVQVDRIAKHLESINASVRLDRRELRPGDSFLNYMEESLRASDYCLLLWSHNAIGLPWVTLEWEAALYRSVKEQRSFLISARLDDAPLPALLAPRLRVDLFPTIEPGMKQLGDLIHSDMRAENATRKALRIGPKKEVARTDEPPITANAELRDEVFVTSELFKIVLPLWARLDAPPGLLVDEVVRRCGLPSHWDHQGRIGVRFEYTLVLGEQVLVDQYSLERQGVRAHDVLWLETQLALVGAERSVRHWPREGPVFRGDGTRQELQAARSFLVEAIAAAGFDEPD